MTTNSDPATQVYLGWANSILCEAGLLVGSLDDLKSGVALATIIDTLWPEAQLSTKVQETESGEVCTYIQNVQVILDYLDGQGISNYIHAQDVVDVDEEAWLDLLWLLILHYSVHSPVTALCDHTEEAGIKNLLEWCLLMLPGVTLNMGRPLVENICEENLLVHLIAQFCPVEEDPEAVGLLMNAMLSAEEYLGISKYIVDPVAMVDGTIPERHILVYLALLRRKGDLFNIWLKEKRKESEQIEEMGSMAAQMAAAADVEKLDWDEISTAEDPTGQPETTDPQQILDMLGDQPITPEMLKQLQDRFGPIEIEIVEDSSEESGEPSAGQNLSNGVLEELDEDLGPINIWPQQPIFYNEGGGKTSNVPLFVELEEAEQAERLSQELVHSRRSDDKDEENEMDFQILGEAAGNVPEANLGLTPRDFGFDQEMEENGNRSSRKDFRSGTLKNLSGSLKPPWMSPVPFSQPCNEMNMHEGHGEHDHLMHSTPRHLSETELSDSDGNAEELGNVDQGKDIENNPIERQREQYQTQSKTDAAAAQDDMEYEETEIDIEDLTKEEIQDLLMAAQEQGVPFDPRLIDLAAQKGLEFEIVMEDEEGNIIDGLPNGEPMRSSNFTELVNELKMASGQDMEVSLQYDSGVGTGTTTATATDTDLESMAASMNIGALQQQIRQHLYQTTDNINEEYSGDDMMPNAPTTSLNDLRDIVEEGGTEGEYGDEDNCSCPTERDEKKSNTTRRRQESTEQHFHNGNRRPESRRGNTKEQLFDLLNKDMTKKSQEKDGSNDDKDSISDEDTNLRRPDSAKSSDIDTDNEDGEKRKWDSNKSDRSFSSNTSIDGIIDTRADLDESEEEIVITMEVPGIPTEDGGFIIDMSKMFIPISIPGQGDQEITVEIDPSGFDFSNMVQNEDGSIEVDIEREVNKWMAQSASKFVRYGSGQGGQPTENMMFPSPADAEGSKITETFENDDSEVNSAIRAAVTEQLHFPNKSSSDESQVYSGPTIRPLSESPASQPQHDVSSRSVDASVTSSSSLFDVSPAEDEVLQLLDQIGNKGHLMRRELESSHQREISLHHEKSEDEVRLGDTIVLLEKELEVLRKENKKLYKEINSGRSMSNRDQNMIQRLESAMDDLQNRAHSLQRENNDLKSLNATLERRSRMVMHKGTMTDNANTENKCFQVGNASFKVRSRTSQTEVAKTSDFGVQQYGHFFSKNAVTSTHDPIFRSLRSKTCGTQSESPIQIDRGVTAMSAQEKHWFGSVANASTQVRAVSKSHDASRKVTKDASTTTTVAQEPTSLAGSKADSKYPWQQRPQSQEQMIRSNIPLKVGKPLRPIHAKSGQRTTASVLSGPLKASQPIEKLFHHLNQGPTESPLMENSATESMDTDDEPEGPDKWQRLSSASLSTDDPTVVKLQRSLASATLENDLLQSKMKQSKTEMATRLGEWADLLEASKSELERAKSDVIGKTDLKNNANIRKLEQKVKELENALANAQRQNQNLSNRIDSSSPQPSTQAPPKVKYLEKQNSQLRNTLEKVKREKDQLVKDFSQLRQHHRHSVEAVTQLESSLVGMASERQNLRTEIQVLRDEYEYLKKGMDIMEQYFNEDVLSNADPDDVINRSTSSCSHTSVVDEAVREADADITVLHQSDLVSKESEAVLSALKDGKSETQVVVMPSGGVEGSLHKHISALAARIQSELGIKVQLVGEVDPSEILGASIHSQEGSKSTTSNPKDKTDSDAVEHLFQSVGPEGTSKKLKLTDLQDVEDIVSRAIPSPRDTSRDSSPVSPRQNDEQKDIGSLNSAELRRKRLGMFVDAYTKPRESSPEGRSGSPSGRSPSPGKSRRASPASHHDDTSEDRFVEPSTDHQMKTYKELRHQIQTQSPLSPRDTSRSPTRNQDTTHKAEQPRKKFTAANTPLLPSKFNLTSVGVPKNGSGPSPDSDLTSGNTSHQWSSSARWKPFSRLAKAARLKQEPRPPSRGHSKLDMNAEAALIQDDILFRYASESGEHNTDERPNYATTSPRYTSNTESNSKIDKEKTHEKLINNIRSEESSANVRAKEQLTSNKKMSQRTIEKSSRPKKDSSVESQRSKLWSHTRPSSVTPITRTETSSVFKDFDYTDYLISKYGGEDESIEDTPISEHHSDFRSSSVVSSLPSPDIIEDSSSSDSDSVLTRPQERPSISYSPQHTLRSHDRFDNVSSYTSKSRTTGVTSSALSSSSIKPKPVNTRTDIGYSPRPLKETPSRPLQEPSSRLADRKRSDNLRTSAQRSNTQRSSRLDKKPATSTATTDAGNLYVTDTSDIASVRLRSTPPLRSDYTSVSSPRLSHTPQPWHSSRASAYSPYMSDTLDTSRSETRTFYSEFFNKGDSDDKYWKEPKQYDYRHEGSASSWREPRRREAWAEADRHWSESPTTNNSKSRLSNGSSNPLPAYESQNSGRSTPYQSLTDQWTFSSSRVTPEAETSGRSSYLDTRGSVSSSMYGLGRKSYDRSRPEVSSPTRSILTKNIRSDMTTLDLYDSSDSTDYSPYNGAAYGNEAFLSPQNERLFMDDILEKYAGNTETSPYHSERGTRSIPVTKSPTDRYNFASTGASYRSGVDLNRYTSALTPSSFPDHHYDLGTSAESYPASRYRSSPKDDFYNYERFSARTTSNPLAEEKEKIRRAEIEELLNKYAPMH